MGLLHHVETLGEDVMARDNHHHHHHHHHQQQLVRERGRRIKAAAELGLARSLRGRQWGRAALADRRALVVAPTKEETSTGKRQEATTPLELEEGRGDHEEEEDEAVVEEKVALLRQLVPGGEDMGVEGLLEETADYIAALEAQVGVMRALACLLSASDLDALRPPELGAAGLLTPQKPV